MAAAGRARGTSTLNWDDGTSAVAWPASSYPYTGAESAIFGGTGGAVTIGSSAGTIAASHLTFNSAGYTIAGSYSLDGASTGLTVTTNADAAISLNISSGVTGTVFTKDGAGALNFASGVTDGTITRFQIVPEPASAVLLALSLGLLANRRRRAALA